MSRTLSQHRPRKRFGQNFLQDAGVIARIVAAINPQAEDHLVEIGPGEGAITAGLVDCGATLDVIELDRDLIPALLASYGLRANFTLHNADVLKFDFSSIRPSDSPRLRVVGNLPYNISTPLIFRLLDCTESIADMHFMLQKEVVERLCATPGSKLWGRVGVMAQYQCAVEYLFDVGPHSFRPAPKVDSAIVRLTPYQNSPWPACDRSGLRRVVQASFAQRRKTLRNNLKGLIDTPALEELGIDPQQRAETLTLEQFIAITNALSNATHYE
ncbi:MAG: 16S rRNA (adenine(1518)-N(6)/adenine(1519)-N(6))-dimethyltransferase RsmA [Gammaproteobacteria bacterium]|nr:16S rRNA (adenine(1518)-N(6)/adenine(1519)-N(6))-dimethyltransferase RsmA [Gammaproteobacteria bacterium]